MVAWMRRHGFERPLSGLQVLAWTIKVVMLSSYFALLVPLHSGLANVLLNVSGAVLALASVSMCIYLTRYNVGHDAVLASAPWLRARPVFDKSSAPIDPVSLFCRVCEVTVSADSKHCGTCQKCVVGFDHHCKWLNNCVGSKSYKAFLVYVSVTLALAFLSLGVCVQLLAHYLTSETSCQRAKFLVYGTEYQRWTIPLLTGTHGVLSLAAVGLLGHLLAYHLWLTAIGETTYSVIRNERRDARRRSAASQAAERADAAETDENQNARAAAPEESTSAISSEPDPRGRRWQARVYPADSQHLPDPSDAWLRAGRGRVADGHARQVPMSPMQHHHLHAYEPPSLSYSHEST